MAVLRFDDILGHEEIIERLKRDLARDRLAHAYLFVGPEGVGKATVARLLGAATLCREPEESERPCGKCLACGKIQRSNHPDFHVVAPAEGKRWIRIDQIRELQAALALRPFEADRRVVIIDCAESMNESAQNAFLKTLEEPPPGTLIVMVAPGAHHLLPTIVSRCRIERLGPLKTEHIVKIMIEERGLDEEHASLVAGLSAGSVGTALAMDSDFAQRIRPAILRRVADISMSKDIDPEKILGVTKQLDMLGDDSLALIRIMLTDVASKKMGRGRISNFDMSDLIDQLAQRWSAQDIVVRFDRTLEAQAGLARNLNRALVFENLLLSFVEGQQG